MLFSYCLQDGKPIARFLDRKTKWSSRAIEGRFPNRIKLDGAEESGVPRL